MSKRSGESSTARRLAIAAGAGVSLAVLGVLAWRMRRDSDVTNHLRIDWDVELEGLEEGASRVASARIPQFKGKRFGEMLGLFSIEAAPYVDSREMPGARVAVAVRDGQSGLWRAGVAAADESEFSRPEESPSTRIAAMYLGNPAMQRLVLGMAHQGEFSAFPTDLIAAAERDEILDSYPDVPILTSMPRESSANM